MRTLHLAKHQLRCMIACGKNSIVSQAGLKVVHWYFMYIGSTAFSEQKAPFLKLINPVPFEVPASANTINFLYFPVYSINSYLSLIFSKAKFLFCSSPPLGIYIQSMAFIRLLKNGRDQNSALGENAAKILLRRTTGSSQLTWLQTTVDIVFLGSN